MRRIVPIVIVAAAICSSAAALAAVGSSTGVCILNYGNKLLNQKKDAEAVVVFEQLFKRQPDFALARKNLATAYNNLAVDHPKSTEAYAAIHKSVALRPDDEHSLQALDWILEETGVDASTTAARIKYADRLKEKGDNFDAFVEYSVALSKTPDPAVQKKIDDLSTVNEKAEGNKLGSVGAVLLLKKITLDHTKDAMFNFDYETYTTEVNRKVTSVWKPPATIGNRQIQLAFDAAPNGSISNLKIVKSSGDKNADDLAINAIRNAVPFKANSSDIPFDVPVTIQLENDVH